MKKIIGKIVNWILVCGLLITMIPVVTKADSTYTRIMPGYTSDLATTIPVDGTDYVATFESGDIENMYFSFEVPESSDNFYSIYYKNLSVDCRTSFTIESSVGEVIHECSYLRASDGCYYNKKLPSGTYILKVHQGNSKKENIKINVSSRKDDVGDSWESAKKIVEGKTLQGSLDGAYDNDYYKFVVPENGTYEIYAKNLSIASKTYFGVYSSSEELMGDRTYIGKNEDGYIHLKCTKGDVYYLRYCYQYSDYQESDFGNYKIYVKNIKPSKIKRINVKNTKSKEVKISWSKISDASGYEVQTATDKKFTNSKTFDESDANIKLYSRSKGTFYVRIRAYKTIDGTTYYGNYSSIKKIKFK